MVQITNWYDFVRHMRKKRRWSSTRPTVVGLKGAELVRARPSELKPPEPIPVFVPPPEPEPESVSEPEPEPVKKKKRNESGS